MLELSINFALEKPELLRSAHPQPSSIIQAWAWRPIPEHIHAVARVNWLPTQEKWETFSPTRVSIYHYSVSVIILGFYSLYFGTLEINQTQLVSPRNNTYAGFREKGTWCAEESTSQEIERSRPVSNFLSLNIFGSQLVVFFNLQNKVYERYYNNKVSDTVFHQM